MDSNFENQIPWHTSVCMHSYIQVPAHTLNYIIHINAPIHRCIHTHIHTDEADVAITNSAFIRKVPGSKTCKATSYVGGSFCGFLPSACQFRNNNLYLENRPFGAIAFVRRFRLSGFHLGFRNNIFLKNKFSSPASNPQLVGTGLRIYVPPVKGWPSHVPRHRIPFSSPLWLGGLR
jgi:hypothetical protein